MADRLRRLSTREAWEYARQLDAVPSVDAVVLKAHALLEGILVRILSGRLNVAAEALPALKFIHLSKLALQGEGLFAPVVKGVEALAAMRNAYAHEWAVTNERELMRGVVDAVPNMGWPDSPGRQEPVFRTAVEWILTFANGAAELANWRDTDWARFKAELQANLEERLRQI